MTGTYMVQKSFFFVHEMPELLGLMSVHIMGEGSISTSSDSVRIDVAERVCGTGPFAAHLALWQAKDRRLTTVNIVCEYLR